MAACDRLSLLVTCPPKWDPLHASVRVGNSFTSSSSGTVKSMLIKKPIKISKKNQKFIDRFANIGCLHRRREGSDFRVWAQEGGGSEGASNPKQEEGERGSEREPIYDAAEIMETDRDPADLYTEMFADAIDAFIAGDIDFNEVMKQVGSIVLQGITDSDILQSIPWYDVDGKRVTEWSVERSHTLLLAKLGDLFGDAVSDCNSQAKRVDWILERELRKEVFSGSPFSVTAVKEGMEGERWFYGEVSGDPDRAYQELDQRMRERFPELVLMLAEDDEFEIPVCSVAYRDAKLTSPVVEGPIFLLFLSATIIFANSLLRTDPVLLSGGAALWGGIVLPLGLVGVILATFLGQAVCSLLYRLPISTFYLPLPSPGIGLVGLTWRDLGLLPNRACLIDQALASSMASVLFSVQLTLTSPPPVPASLQKLATDFGWFETAGALSNIVLVDASVFSYSAVLSELASHMSVATVPTPGGETLLAIGPLALTGLLGLNMTALNLLPFGMLSGGRVIRGLGGFSALLVSSVITAVLVTIFAFMEPQSFWGWFGLGMALSAISTYEMQRNGLSSPGNLRSFLGLGMIGMAVFTLLPPPIFYGIFGQGPGALVEEVEQAFFLF